MFRVHHYLQSPYARPSLVALCVAFSVQAQAQDFALNLPAQPLATSLSQVAQQTQVQLLFDETLLRNVQAPALSGTFGAEDAIRHLLRGSAFTLVKVDNTFVVRASEVPANEEGMSLGALSIVGDGAQVDSNSVGRSTLSQVDIDRRQPNNIGSLLSTLPGVTAGGSPKPGGQTLNIWGMGDAEDVPLTLNGAPKSGFERYQQGTIFIEPELIKSIEVEKGPHSPFTGNGGFGGTVNMTTKDAPDLLEQGRDTGAMLKYGYSSNDHQQIYTGAAYGRTDNGMADALVYYTKRDGDDLKLAAQRPDPDNRYPINPKRLPNSAQDLDAELFKINLHPNDEHSLGLSYTRSNSERMTPFSSNSYPTPPTAANIARYGYEGALRRLLADRSTIDTTWSAKYEYQPLDNPLVDMSLSYSHSKTEQTDERGENAFYQPATGGKKMDTSYRDDVLELRNTSLFETGPFAHALTLGSQLRKHKRDTLMYMPGATYDKPQYNYGHYQPGFMPRGKVDSQGYYIKDAMTIGDVTITPSLRFDEVRNDGKKNLAPLYNTPGVHDYSSQTYSGWSPRLSLYWAPLQQLAFFADYSKTWRAPVIDEQYEVQSPTSTRNRTSRDLDPERITALRAGSVLTLNRLVVDSDNLQIRTTLFRNEIKDEIFKNLGIDCENQYNTGGTISNSCPAGNRPIYRNLNGSTIKGFEVESFYDSNWVFGAISYSWMTGKHDGAYLNPWGPDVWARDIASPKFVTTLGTKIPPLDMQVGWQAEFVRKTDRVPSEDWASDFPYDEAENDNYDVHSLFANWKPHQKGLKGTEVNLTIDNLFNKDYIPQLSGDGVRSQGRNAKVSITRFF
ncbi:TonB-dependent receptor [Pseudomonas turukhanskensis]|uniref:Heme utilization protein n=1 Tax=Pseudomonas turukhanskensis TaxID=1806536 RepID=A0A9W6NEN5_9PSED|nr:TonB-dependent receptor [Pseudomonas turukhanskensis]GLK88884.1 heme utilization protein [Pseudomonas turukhanskensis]